MWRHTKETSVGHKHAQKINCSTLSSARAEAADWTVDKECEQSRTNMQGRWKWKFLTRASQTGAVQTSSVSFEQNHNLVTWYVPPTFHWLCLKHMCFQRALVLSKVYVGRLQRKVLTGDQSLGGKLHGGERNHWQMYRRSGWNFFFASDGKVFRKHWCFAVHMWRWHHWVSILGKACFPRLVPGCPCNKMERCHEHGLINFEKVYWMNAW